ncbi:MAG: arginine--tRNA ligase [Candidatus Heimdallarchaeaceae archaeon]
MSSRVYDDIKEVIIKVLKNNYKKELDLDWTFPRSSELGDISFPLFNISKELKKSPQEIGNFILENLPKTNIIGTTALQGGFLNIFLKKNEFFSKLLNSLLAQEKYGASKIKSKERIIVEHTSSNPTGPLHVGNARSSIIGDVIGRLYKFLGAEVNIRYYVNDLGRQIAPLVIGYQLVKNKIKPDVKIDLWVGKLYAIMNTLLEINQIKHLMESKGSKISSKSSKYELTESEIAEYENILENKDPENKISSQLNKLLRIQSSLKDRIPELYSVLHKATNENIDDLNSQTTLYVKIFQEGKDKEIVSQFRELTEKVLAGHIETLEMLNIFVDDYDWESVYAWSGEVPQVLDELSNKGYLRHDGKAMLLLCDKIATETSYKSKYDIKHEMSDLIIVNSEGITLYVCRDIVYHLHKLDKFNATYCYNVISKQQQLAQQGVKLALYALGKSDIADKIEHYDYEYVSLVGRKMAGREFEYVTPDEIYELTQKEIYEILKNREYQQDQMDEIAQKVSSSSVKYHILKMDPQKTIKFDVKKAADPNENSGPFLQYSYARALNILLKAPEKGIDVKEIIDNANSIDLKLESEAEWNLIKMIEDLPHVLIKSLNTLKPDSVANFTYSLASAFHKFYDACPVLIAKEESVLQTRILIVYSTIKCLESLFEVMGIVILEKM